MSDSKTGLSDEELQSIFEDGEDEDGEDGEDGAEKEAPDSETSTAEGTITFEGLAAKAQPTSTGALFSAWESEFGRGKQVDSDEILKSESSGLHDILAVAAAIRNSPDERESDGDTEELLGAGDGAPVGLIIAADDDHLDAAAEGFGGTGAAALVDHGDSGLINLAEAGGGDLVSEARAAAEKKAQTAREGEAAREQREGAKRRPWIAAIVLLVAIGGGVGLVLSQGDEGSGAPAVARAEQSTMTAAARKEVDSADIREADRLRDRAERADTEAMETEPEAAGTEDEALLAVAGTDEAQEGTDEPERGSGVVDSKRAANGKDKTSAKAKATGSGEGEGEGEGEREPEAGEQSEKATDEPDPPEAADDAPAGEKAADEGEEGAQAPADKPDDGPSDQDKVDCLLNPDQPKCGGKKKQEDTQESKDDGPKLPEKLSATQLRNGFAPIKGAAKKCGEQHGAEPGTKVKIHVSIEGATGKVKSAKPKGEHAGTALGDCVAKAAMDASFGQFTKQVMGTDFSLRM